MSDALADHPTASVLCVIAGIRPSRAAAHCTQPQFHWGRPPPAPAPRTMIRTAPRSERMFGTRIIFRRAVHVDFHTAGNVFDDGFLPGHLFLLQNVDSSPCQAAPVRPASQCDQGLGSLDRVSSPPLPPAHRRQPSCAPTPSSAASPLLQRQDWGSHRRPG